MAQREASTPGWDGSEMGVKKSEVQLCSAQTWSGGWNGLGVRSVEMLCGHFAGWLSRLASPPLAAATLAAQRHSLSGVGLASGILVTFQLVKLALNLVFHPSRPRTYNLNLFDFTLSMFFCSGDKPSRLNQTS